MLFKFQRGRRNLIFATEVLEEGIDVPQCSLAVIFNLKSNLKSFIQSRGRARHKGVCTGAGPRWGKLTECMRARDGESCSFLHARSPCSRFSGFRPPPVSTRTSANGQTPSL